MTVRSEAAHLLQIDDCLDHAYEDEAVTLADHLAGSDRRNHASGPFDLHQEKAGKMAQARLLDRLADIRVSEAKHGPPGERRYEYTPIYLMRGLEQLHLEFTPSSDRRVRP